MIRKVLMLICVVVFLFSGYQLVMIEQEYQEMEEEHNQLSEAVVEIVESEEIGEPNEIKVDFESLIEKYPDVVGWLYQEGTVINYPVVKTDNNDTYVRANLDQKYSRAGTLFIDYRCNDEVIIIYGHNMLDGSMLASILDYRDQHYYDEYPSMKYLTADKKYTFEIISGFVTDVYDELYDLESPDWLDNRTSDFKAKNEYLEGKLLILSTCYKQTGDERYVLVGSLIEVEE